jgi:hypothetical protein
MTQIKNTGQMMDLFVIYHVLIYQIKITFMKKIIYAMSLPLLALMIADIIIQKQMVLNNARVNMIVLKIKIINISLVMNARKTAMDIIN